MGWYHGALDVGFLLLPCDTGALALAQVLRIELLAALPEDHPLSTRPEVPMRALADERLILYARHFHPGCYDYIVHCCREAGFSPHFVRTHEPQLYSGDTTYRMVAAGAGIAIVVPPVGPAPLQSPGVAFRPLREPTPVLNVAAAWRPTDTSPTLRAFLEIVREYIPAEARASDPRSRSDDALAPRD